QRAAELQVAADDAATQVAQLRQEIAQLEVSLQPPPLQAVVPLAPAAPSGTTGITAVSIADEYLGVPYRWGGADPLTGFDCSGLTMYVYAQLGIHLPHYAGDQWRELLHVDASQLEPGDVRRRGRRPSSRFVLRPFAGPGRAGRRRTPRPCRSPRRRDGGGARRRRGSARSARRRRRRRSAARSLRVSAARGSGRCSR